MADSRKLRRAVLFLIASAFFFALMNMFVRLSGNIPTFEKTFFRNFFALFIASGAMIKNRCSVIPPKGARLDVICRSVFGYAGVICNFYAIDRLDLSDASLLNKMSPFFAIIASYFLLKEKVAPYQAVCVLLAFIGALFILRPGFDSMVTIPALIGLLGGLGAGIAYTMVRILGGHGVKGPIIVFAFSLFSVLVTAPYLVFAYKPMSMQQFLCLMLAGIAAAGGQFSITAAYTHAPAKEISVFDYMQIVFSSLLGIFILHEMPTVFSVIGYVIIIGASIIMFLLNRRKDRTSETV